MKRLPALDVAAADPHLHGGRARFRRIGCNLRRRAEDSLLLRAQEWVAAIDVIVAAPVGSSGLLSLNKAAGATTWCVLSSMKKNSA